MFVCTDSSGLVLPVCRIKDFYLLPPAFVFSYLLTNSWNCLPVLLHLLHLTVRRNLHYICICFLYQKVQFAQALPPQPSDFRPSHFHDVNSSEVRKAWSPVCNWTLSKMVVKKKKIIFIYIYTQKFVFLFADTCGQQLIHSSQSCRRSSTIQWI